MQVDSALQSMTKNKLFDNKVVLNVCGLWLFDPNRMFEVMDGSGYFSAIVKKTEVA